MVAHEHEADRKVDGVAQPDEARGLPKHRRPIGDGTGLQELTHTACIVNRRVWRGQDVQDVLQFLGARCGSQTVTNGEEVHVIKGAPQLLRLETEAPLGLRRV